MLLQCKYLLRFFQHLKLQKHVFLSCEQIISLCIFLTRTWNCFYGLSMKEIFITLLLNGVLTTNYLKLSQLFVVCQSKHIAVLSFPVFVTKYVIKGRCFCQNNFTNTSIKIFGKYESIGKPWITNIQPILSLSWTSVYVLDIK